MLIVNTTSRSSSEQIALLRKAENRQIIQKVADDTATLRTRSHHAMSCADSISLNNGQPSVGDTVFDFDDTVVNSRAYREALRHSRSKPERNINQSSFMDEGYGTGLAHNTPNASIPSRSPSQPHPYESVSPDFGRRKTTNSSKTNALYSNQGNIQRWQSDSAYSSAFPSRSSGSRREKIRALIRRLSSTSGSGRSDSPTTSPVVESAGGRRNCARDFNTSINLKTFEGTSAPVIVKVAQTGSRDDVERLIQSGHDIEARHIHSRRNALLVASHCGNDEIVDLLIQNNARLDAVDGSGSTAVHLAASRGHLEVLGLLLSENVDIETRNSQGRTALWLAADQGQLDAIRMLVATQAKVNTRADNQMTALHVAAKRGDVNIVDFLISQGADLEAKDASMMSALHYASEEGHLSVMELLISTSRVDINVPGCDRRTPLICGATMGRLPVVQLLLRKKVSIKSVDDAGMTALHWAAFNGHTEIVSLLGQKKGPLAMTNIAGRTVLHLAVMNAQFAVVELLCRRDDVSLLLEARCESGLSPLHYACIADNLDITRLLLATGSNIEEPTDGDQRRPVHIAAACGSMGLLNLLCDKGASLDARDAIGDRAICVACRQGRASAAQNLLNRGSALYMKFGSGSRLHEDSPLCLAAMGGHYPVVSLLLQHGASPVRSDETGWQPARYAAHYGHPEVLQLLLANRPTSANDVAESGLSLTTSERIGFAPHAVIPEERKRRVRELLDQSRRQSLAATEHTPRPIQMSPFEPVNNQITMPPQELPGTLEQGLPDSRSATPDQMRRDNTTSSQAVVGTADLQQALPPAYEQTPTAPTQQPQAVSGIGAAQPCVDTLPLREHTFLSTGVSVSPTPLPTSGAQNMSQRLNTLLHNHATERGDDARSETSSVTSVYTAPEGATVHELPA